VRMKVTGSYPKCPRFVEEGVDCGCYCAPTFYGKRAGGWAEVDLPRLVSCCSPTDELYDGSAFYFCVGYV